MILTHMLPILGTIIERVTKSYSTYKGNKARCEHLEQFLKTVEATKEYLLQTCEIETEQLQANLKMLEDSIQAIHNFIEGREKLTSCCMFTCGIILAESDREEIISLRTNLHEALTLFSIANSAHTLSPRRKHYTIQNQTHSPIFMFSSNNPKCDLGSNNKALDINPSSPIASEEIYRNGLTSEQHGDLNNAFEFFQNAAERGHVLASIKQAEYLSKGKVGQTNFSSAFNLYRKAANQNNAEAQYQTGMMLMKGQGLSPNKRVALQWLKKAADQNHPAAIQELNNFNQNSTTSTFQPQLNLSPSAK